MKRQNPGKYICKCAFAREKFATPITVLFSARTQVQNYTILILLSCNIAKRNLRTPGLEQHQPSHGRKSPRKSFTPPAPASVANAVGVSLVAQISPSSRAPPSYLFHLPSPLSLSFFFRSFLVNLSFAGSRLETDGKPEGSNERED